MSETPRIIQATPKSEPNLKASTVFCDVDPRDARIAELEAALRELVTAAEPFTNAMINVNQLGGATVVYREGNGEEWIGRPEFESLFSASAKAGRLFERGS